MARKRDPFPVARLGGPQMPPGNVKERTFRPNGMDGQTGPDYASRRGNTPVSGTSKSVRRFGVQVGNRGEWKR